MVPGEIEMSGRNRALAAGLVLATLLIGVAFGCWPSRPHAEAGRKEFQSLGWVPVPHGMVNMIGGNLLIERSDLDLDTRVGRLDLGATWNSATRDWIWSFEPTFDGETFRDASGALHDVSGVAAEAPIPGTHWVAVDAETIRTKGGLVYEFDSTGRLAVVRWRSATWPQLRYVGGFVAGSTRTVEIRQYESASSWTRMATIERDAAGRVSAVEDRTGRRAVYTRDSAGRLVGARDALDLEEGWPGFRYAYDPNGHLAAITSSEGERTEYAAAALRTTRVRSIGLGDPTWRFAYGKTGAISTAELEDPLGSRRFWRYDDQRRVLELESAAADVTRLTWNGLRPRGLTTPAGVTTHYHHVGDDLAHVLQPSGNVVDFVWAPDAENRAEPARRALAEVRDSVGVLEARSYDAAGRLASITNGAGETWQFGWNSAGLLADVTDPAGRETGYRDYGSHGHPRRIEGAVDALELDWDDVGNLRSPGGGAGGGPGGVIERLYDGDRNLVRLLLGDLDAFASTATRTLDLTYRSDGRPVRIDRPYGGDTEWIYDALGRRTGRRDFADGLWRTTTWEHDAAGQTTARELPNGMRTEWQHDAAGRVTRIAHARGANVEQHADLSWSDGRIVAVADSAAADETWLYDAAGRVERIVDESGDTRVLSYDSRSRVVSEFYWLGSGWPLADVQLDYDGANREVELRRGEQLLRRRTFVAGRLAGEEFGNGLVRTDAYDPVDGLLASTHLRGAGGALLARALLARAVSGAGTGALSWDVAASSFGSLPANTDEVHHLAPLEPGAPGARIAASATGAGASSVSRGWDELSNPVSVGNPGAPNRRTFHYDGARTRLEEVRGGSGAAVHTYGFDAAGFVTQRDGEAITWDARGRPVAAPGSFWLWDALGRLRAASHAGETRLRRFGGRVESALDGTPIALDLGAVVLDLTAGGGNHRFRHLDFRGNVKWVSDMSGTVVAHFGYGPHGVLAEHGAASTGERTFAQGMPAGELLRLGHRLYDPEIGRFLAPDPVYQVVNQYGYTLGDPVHFWDPSGREVAALTVARGIAAGAAIAGTVGVASALTLGAPVAVFAVAALGASGVYAGLLVPYSVQSAATAGGIGAVLRYPYGSAFGGFMAGQALQAALAEPMVPPRGAEERPPRPPTPPDPPGPTTKQLDLRLAPSEFGCSPTGIAASTPAVPRTLWMAAALVQLVAALRVARRSRRRNRQ
jgi:RHS repeat-associated protein